MYLPTLSNNTRLSYEDLCTNSVAFINNYSTLSEERHKKISSILSNTETNRNALVPVQFSANLPRKASTNSTASSTSDV
jgi:hypothetical protein